MNNENQMIIVGLLCGIAIGTCVMMMVNINKDIRINNKIEFIIRENINTCEDMIEWMNYDVENYADSTVFDMYIYNLEQMCEENRVELLKIYRNE